MSVPSSSICGLRCPICQFGITVKPTHEKANVPKIPRKRGARPFISTWLRRLGNRRSLVREREGLVLSYVRFRTLRLNWIEECWDSRLSAQTQEHQPKVIREDKMRHSEQNAGQAAPTQIGQDRFRGLAES